MSTIALCPRVKELLEFLHIVRVCDGHGGVSEVCCWSMEVAWRPHE